MSRDPYEVLGVERDADGETIKQAYRRHARALHPDVSAREGADERLHEVNEAYAILSDPDSRRLYDRLGWRGKGHGIAPRPGVARVYASNPRAFLEDVDSVLAAASGRKARKEPTRVVGEVELDAYEAHVGATRKVDAEEPVTCEECGGTRRRSVVSNRESGRFLSLVACDDCGGTGQLLGARRVDVTVPPRSRDLDPIPVGPEAVAIVRIVPARERIAVRLAASAALLLAVGFLIFLLSL